MRRDARLSGLLLTRAQVTSLSDGELLVLRRQDFSEIIRDDKEVCCCCCCCCCFFCCFYNHHPSPPTPQALDKISSIVGSLKLANAAGISSLRHFA